MYHIYMTEFQVMELKILGHERARNEVYTSTIDSFKKLEDMFGRMKKDLTEKIQLRRDRVENIKRKIEMVVQKIQVIGQANRPLTFQCPDKYPEIQRLEKIQHSHLNRHAAIYQPLQENKELIHPEEQLVKMVYAMENELKDMLEITREVLNSKSYPSAVSNDDVINGVGDAPRQVTSLSDFLVYGGSRNPYAPELKEFDKPKDTEKLKAEERRMKGDELTPNVLVRSGTRESSVGIVVKNSRPAPTLVAKLNVELEGAHEISPEMAAFDQMDDDDISLQPSGNAFMPLRESFGDDNDNYAKMEDQNIHGGMLDFIMDKKSSYQRSSNTNSQKPPPSVPSAMPRQEAYVPAESTYYSHAPANAPPPVSAPTPPNIDVPLPPAPSIDVPLPPAPPMDIPLPPISMPEVPVPPPSIDIPLPPISVPTPPPPKPAAAPPAKKPAAQGGARSKFLDSVRCANPLSRLKAVPKDQVKDASKTMSEKKKEETKKAAAGMASAQSSLMDQIRMRYQQMNKHSREQKKVAKQESDDSDSDDQAAPHSQI